MGKSFALLLALVLLTASCVLTFLPVHAESRKIVVPDDYPTINSAIGNATEGDTIFVRQGLYEEHSLIINKTIRLMSEDKGNTTIINIDEPPAWNSAKPDVIHITADNVKISGFTLTSKSEGFGLITKGIYAAGNGIAIIDNIITELNGVHSAIGIDVSGQRNQIIDNSVLGILDGISFTGSYSAIIQNKIEKGQFLGSGQHNLIMSNIVSKGYTEGMNLKGDNNLIFNNTVTEQNHGISVSGTGNILMVNNASNNVLCGIDIRSPIESYGNNIVYANTIANNRDGLFLIEGKNNSAYANNIISNHVGVAILWYRGWMDHIAYDNAVYHNNFVNNDYGAADWSHVGINAWDNGFEGNFWDAYAGTDANYDGIGDMSVNINVPYTIGNSDPKIYDPKEANPNEVLDRYPLMAPFDVDSLVIELPEWVSSAFELESSPLILSPQNITYTVTNVSLNFSSSRFVKLVRYSLDGQDNVTIAENMTLVGLDNGSHNLTLFADNLFGNTIASKTIHFSVEVPESFSLALVPVTSAATLAIIGVGLFLYFKKRKH